MAADMPGDRAYASEQVLPPWSQGAELLRPRGHLCGPRSFITEPHQRCSLPVRIIVFWILVVTFLIPGPLSPRSWTHFPEEGSLYVDHKALGSSGSSPGSRRGGRVFWS